MSIAMQERKEPDFISFQNVGDRIEGRLLSIEPIAVKNGQANRYTFDLLNGERKALLGTAKIDSLVSGDDIFHLVFIVFTGDNKAVGMDRGNAMKEFKVGVSERPVRRVKQGDKWEWVEVSE
jgi:hypothetical protein